MLCRVSSRLAAVAFAAAVFFAGEASAQTIGCTGVTAGNCVPVVPFSTGGAINNANPLPTTAATPAVGTVGAGYPPGATPIAVAGTGTTGAVTATLAASATKFTYICGFHIDATGSASVGPITMTGLIGPTTFTFQGTAGSNQLPVQTFTPCIPSNAVNTAITITTTADATATAVDVNAWGFQQ